MRQHVAFPVVLERSVVDQADGKRGALVLSSSTGSGSPERCQRAVTGRSVAGNGRAVARRPRRWKQTHLSGSICAAFALVGETDESGVDQTGKMMIQQKVTFEQVRPPTFERPNFGWVVPTVSKQSVDWACSAVVGSGIPSFRTNESESINHETTVDV